MKNWAITLSLLTFVSFLLAIWLPDNEMRRRFFETGVLLAFVTFGSLAVWVESSHA